MKGIILAAGKGTRLYPMTKPVCKPLLPVYDKPMIYYPLAVLQMADIRDVLIIVPPDDMEPFVRLLGDGSDLGMNINYVEQKVQRGIADAFIVGEEFIGDDRVCLVLGDNIFYGELLPEKLAQAAANEHGATVFGYYVEHPEAFGVVEFDEHGKAISIEEKPQHPKSNYIVPGLYFYDNRVIDIAKQVRPSARGELEITSVNNAYLRSGELSVVKLESDFTWLDAGTEDSLLESALEIRALQQSLGVYVGCIEQISYEKGWISPQQLHELANGMSKTKYGNHLYHVAVANRNGK
jgi:glucose-1-phosphate thymidylyltransferase